MKNGYILELAWGCPNEKYPLNGIFQFDQASALKDEGRNVIYAAVDVRSIRNWRPFGINYRVWEGIEVYEYNFPFGPFFPQVRQKVEKRCFEKLIREIIKQKGMPLCIHIHNCDVALCASEYCVNNNIEYVITEHSTPAEKPKQVEEKKKWTYKNAKQVITVSHSLSKKLEDKYDIESVVIPNIVIMKKGDELHFEKIHNEGMFTFVSAARLVEGKGFDVLLEAFKLVLLEKSDCCLMILGDGPEGAALKDRAKRLGIENKVSFYGAYNKEQFSEKLMEADCFVLASRSETFGIVYIEALSCGVPVIATKCGGPEDFIEDLNGILVDVDDVNGLKDAMVYMKSSIKRYNRSEIAITCKMKFSPSVIARRIMGVIDG